MAHEPRQFPPNRHGPAAGVEDLHRLANLQGRSASNLAAFLLENALRNLPGGDRMAGLSAMGAFYSVGTMFHTIAGLSPAEKVRLAAAILASLPHAQTISGLYGEPLTHLEDLADDLSRCSPDELIAGPPGPLWGLFCCPDLRTIISPVLTLNCDLFSTALRPATPPIPTPDLLSVLAVGPPRKAGRGVTCAVAGGGNRIGGRQPLPLEWPLECDFKGEGRLECDFNGEWPGMAPGMQFLHRGSEWPGMASTPSMQKLHNATHTPVGAGGLANLEAHHVDPRNHQHFTQSGR